MSLLIAGGCRDTKSLVSQAVRESPSSIVPQIVIAQTGNLATLTIAATVSGDIGRVGSFTARLVYDPSRLTFDSEVPLGDGTLRAFNPSAGMIRVAGASPSGVDVGQLAAFRFRVADPSGLESVELVFDEIHATSRANLKAHVRLGTLTRTFR